MILKLFFAVVEAIDGSPGSVVIRGALKGNFASKLVSTLILIKAEGFPTI